MKNRIKNLITQTLGLCVDIKDYFNRWTDAVLGSLILISLLVLTASAVLLFAIAWHQLSLVGNETPKPSALVSASKFVLEFFISNPPYDQPEKINAELSILVGVLGAFATSFFSIAAGASTFYLRRKIKESATIQTFRVYKEGVDDIKIMLREYARGSRVVIFGGDFSWVDKAGAKEKITQLAGKRSIKFISYKTISDIQSEIDKTMFENISPMLSSDNSLQGLKASLIYDSDGNLLAYLYQTKTDDQQKIHVCKIQGINPDGRRLLRQIDSFARNYPHQMPNPTPLKVTLVCGKSKTGKSHFCGLISSNSYSLISAGGVVRELYQEQFGTIPTSIELIKYGQETLTPNSALGIKFRDILLKAIHESIRPIVIDGLRTPWIFSEIMQIYKGRANFILFESPDEERKKLIGILPKGSLNSQLFSSLHALDCNVDLFEKLVAPIYKGRGGDTAFNSVALQKYRI